MAKELINVARF